MATITLTIPDALLSGLAASVRSAYGEAVAALSDADAAKHAATAVLSRKDAEDAALAQADTDFEAVA